jgi:nicotinamidase-related amidase
MSTAVLLAIDLLVDYFERQPRLAAERQRITVATNQLTRTLRQHSHRIIWVRQEFAPDLHDAFADMRARNVSITIAGTRGAEILPELERAPADITIVKKRYSAFFGTRLDEILDAARPDLIIVAGINTHACVRTTAIDAYQRDYRVIVAAEATASYDPEHHEVTRRYLHGKIATFLTNQEIHVILGGG